MSSSSSSTKPPRPPTGYRSLKVDPGEVLLHLTISNKCGQAFRWRGTAVWDSPNDENPSIIKEEPAVKVKGERIPTSTTSSFASNITTKPDPDSAGGDSPVKATIKNETGAQQTPQTEWSLCLSDRVILLRQDVDRGYLYFNALRPSNPSQNPMDQIELLESTELWLKDYLNLEVPLDEMYKEWAEKDKVFARFATRFAGIRMLRQDPWECLCAFICSSNNNIARIGQMVQKLATHYSDPIVEYTYPAAPSTKTEEEENSEITSAPTTITFHPFPSPSRLAQPDVEEGLRTLGFGYRAKYIARTAQMLCEENSDLFKFEQLKAQEAKEKKQIENKKNQKGKGKGKRNEVEMLSPASTIGHDQDDVEYQNNGRTKRVRKTTSNALTPVSTPKGKSRGKEIKPDTPDQTPTSTPAPSTSSRDKKSQGMDYGADVDSKVFDFLFSLRKLAYSEAKEKLIVYQGVGPKVADCILLMSLDQPSSIPVDRHVFAFASKWYGIKTTRYDEVADAFRKIWGEEWAGWAHSVLFAADLRAFQDYQPTPKKEEALEEAAAVGGAGGAGFAKIKIEEESR